QRRRCGARSRPAPARRASPIAAPAASVPRVWPFRRTFYGWAIVGASFAAVFGEVPAFGPILGVFIEPIERELGWSRATISTAFMIGSATGALASVVVGRLVDRHGPRVVVAAGGLLIAGALLGLSTVQEPWQFWAYFGLARASAIAGVELGTSVAIAKWFVRKRGRALGLKAVGQRLGQAVMPLGIFAVMTAADWRAAYVVLAGLAAVLIVLPSALLLRRRPEDHGLLPDGAARQGRGAEGTADPSGEVSWTLAEARRTRSFWLIAVFLSLTPFVQGAVNLHMVVNFHDKGLAPALAVSIASIFAATSALSILPIGFLLERVHVRYAGMVQALLVLASMLILLVADTYPMAVAFAVVFGVGAGMRNLVEVMLLANYFGRESLGAIKGFTAPLRAISPIGPVLAGFLRDTTGTYTVAFVIFAGVAVAMFVLMVFATPPKRPLAGAQPRA
ncbi:MAG: MFS transporter, partial [Chloroflexi bacterium]|nr:MFS transporter [Chloroflexota bacterium]